MRPRPGRTQTGISQYRSPYISFHAFTWDRPKNEFRPVAEKSYRRLPDTRYFPAVLPVTVQSSCKTETNLRPGPQIAYFFVWLHHFCFFLEKNRNIATDNIRSSFSAWIDVRDRTTLRCCAVNINRPLDERQLTIFSWKQHLNLRLSTHCLLA